MKTRKIINIILTIITGLLFTLTIIVLISGIRATKRNEIAIIFGFTYSIVDSESMEDAINVGDLVFTKDIEFSQIDVDDIVLFYGFSKKYNREIRVIHRVIEIKEDGSLRTQGDNNSYADDAKESDLRDGFVTEDSYIGKYIGKIPKVGNLTRNYRNIIFGIIFLIFFTIIIIEIKNIIVSLIEDKREKLEKEYQEKRKQIDEFDDFSNK